jgi:hypothetical protein
MLKVIGYITFFFIFINPLVIFSQECNKAIPSTTSHLQDNGDGTISDPKMGLVWKKCNEGQNWNSGDNSCEGKANSYDWLAALQQAKNINNDSEEENRGKMDWRVPNIKELISIVELKCWNPSVNISVFPRTPVSWYWSSSLYTYYGTNYAWSSYFYYGHKDGNDKDNSKHVRLVRSEK